MATVQQFWDLWYGPIYGQKHSSSDARTMFDFAEAFHAYMLEQDKLNHKWAPCERGCDGADMMHDCNAEPAPQPRATNLKEGIHVDTEYLNEPNATHREPVDKFSGLPSAVPPNAVCCHCNAAIEFDGGIWYSNDAGGNQRMWCENGETQHQPESAGPVCPDGYAYRYHDFSGGTVIRFNHGEEVNGGKPIEATPFFFRGAPAEPQRWRGVKAELPEEGSEVFAAVWWTTEETSHSSYEVHDCCFWKQGEEWGPKDIFVDCDGTEFDAEEVSFWIYRKDLVAHLPAPKERP